MILLDTNVISELMRSAPDPALIAWHDRQPSGTIWTTAISIFEVRFGLETMPEGQRKTILTTVFECWLNELVQGRIAVFDEAAARKAAELDAMRRKMGRPGELRDTMIAGIVLANHATLATRNAKHFEDIAGSVVNPWEKS
jgi:predicted nucleic acid-binding protein